MKTPLLTTYHLDGNTQKISSQNFSDEVLLWKAIEGLMYGLSQLP
jgi:hypothetical protein